MISKSKYSIWVTGNWMRRVQLEENAVFQIPSSLASHSAPPSAFSEIGVNPSFGSSVQRLAQAQTWGLTAAPSRPWAGPPKECGCSGTALTPTRESPAQAFSPWKECRQAAEARQQWTPKNLPSCCSRDEHHHLGGKIFPWNTPSAIAIIGSIIEKTSKQASKKERCLVVVSLKNKQSSHEVCKSFQYYILILHRR